MKKISLSIVLVLVSVIMSAKGPKLGLPGDNLDLCGVLNIFQQSQTLEDFETSLNDEHSKVNNLDLNNDGLIDYISVNDQTDGAAHAIVLRTHITENETRDLAVIEVGKDNDNQVHVQIVGDEALYGEDYILEPGQEMIGPDRKSEAIAKAVLYSCATWAVISNLYAAAYTAYTSPYHWNNYPHYWYAWEPVRYNVYYSHNSSYHNLYKRGNTYHSPAVHAFYTSHKSNAVAANENYNHSRTFSQPSSPGSNRTNSYKINKQSRHTYPSRMKTDKLSLRTFQPRQKTYNSIQRTHQPRQKAYNSTQRTYQPRQNTYNSNQRTHQPRQKTYNSTQRTYQPRQNTYNSNQRTHQPRQKTYNSTQRTYQPKQKTYNSSQRTYQPNQKTYNSNQRTHQPRQKTNNSTQRTYQPRQKTYQSSRVNNNSGKTYSRPQSTYNRSNSYRRK